MKCATCKKDFIAELKKDGSEYKTCRVCLEKMKLYIESNKCEHGKRRYRCIECGGESICEHNREQSRCIECKGSQICEHGKHKFRCKDCGGSSICEHNRERSHCKDCGGSQICKHNRERSCCKECGGISICEHNRVRSHCKECDGIIFCEHNKRKGRCVICTPNRACKKCLSIYIAPSFKYHPYCFSCFCIENPDAEIPKKYKLKEHHLRDFLKEEYKNLDMVFDKSVGESNKRPDVLINFQNHNIMIECDENQHKRSNYNCETKREMEIFQDLENKPLVCIRFNPDNYLDGIGKLVHGCFEMTKTAGWKIVKPEWIRRINILKQVINNFISEPPTKEFTKISLFYNDE